jgi:hypothetical protein
MIRPILNISELAETLHRGNSAVPDFCRHSFYDAKKFLLSAFGVADGRDIQRIDKDCWRCFGKGTYTTYRYGEVYDVEPCYKCNATGRFSSRMIWLDRFTLGHYQFHVPVPGVDFGPEAKPTIIGKIEHVRYADATECAATLAWLFNRDALRNEVLSWPHAAMIYEYPLTFNGPAAVAINQWVKDKRLEDDRAWKAHVEEKVDGCPF